MESPPSEDLAMSQRHHRWLDGGGLLLAIGALVLTAAPAAATNTSLTVDGSGGTTTCPTSTGLGMSWTTPSFALGTITLNGSNQTATVSDTLEVDDNTGCGAGWNVSATGTELFNGTNYIASAPSFPAPGWSCTNGVGTCTLPGGGTAIGYPYNMPVGVTAPAATELVSDGAAAGMGNQQTTEVISLVVPGSAYTGIYASTWTFVAAVGP